MDQKLVIEIGKLRKLSVQDLRRKYREVFGDETRSGNKDYLFKRIAYRMQEKKYGGLTERARKRAAELAEDAPIRQRMPADVDAIVPPRERDPRLPSPGTVLRRAHNGEVHEVLVLEAGFEYREEHFTNLSALARHISGARWNGYGFFGLLAKESA